MNKRETWIDIAKGFGIVAVVLGHSNPQSVLSHYLYWFHMPLFFVLSGYLFKPLDNREKLFRWIKKRSIQLLVPYFSFGLIILIFRFGYQMYEKDFGLMSAVKEVVRLVYGGTTLTSWFSVFWFVTCLIVTQIAFALITYRFKSLTVQLAIIVGAFIVAHLQTAFVHFDKFPWNADVALLSLTYYAFGYYAKQYKQIIGRFSIIIAVLISATAFALDKADVLTYTLDVKVHKYTNVLLDAIIPLAIVVLFCGICRLIERTPILGTLGSMSLTIMYLHFPLNYATKELLATSGVLEFVLIGLIPPIIIHMIVQRFKVTNTLFQGSFKKQKYIVGLK